MDIVEWDGSQPEALRPLIGLRVKRVWVLPWNAIAVNLEGGGYVSFQTVPAVGFKAALSINTGWEKPGVDFSALDKACGQDEYVRNLRGLKFIGIDANLVMFEGYGALVLPDGI